MRPSRAPELVRRLRLLGVRVTPLDVTHRLLHSRHRLLGALHRLRCVAHRSLVVGVPPLLAALRSLHSSVRTRVPRVSSQLPSGCSTIVGGCSYHASGGAELGMLRSRLGVDRRRLTPHRLLDPSTSTTVERGDSYECLDGRRGRPKRHLSDSPSSTDVRVEVLDPLIHLLGLQPRAPRRRRQHRRRRTEEERVHERDVNMCVTVEGSTNDDGSSNGHTTLRKVRSGAGT